MDKRTYDKIAAKWKGRPHYNWPAGRMNAVQRVARKAFPGRVVVDIGCNAGLLTYEIARYAKGFIGIEVEEHFYQQALVTQKVIKTPGRFLNCKLRHFLKRLDEYEFDAVFACRVLYHLKTLEVEKMRELLLPRCKVAVFVSREDKREKDQNPYQLQRREKIEEFLQAAGFATEVAHRRNRCFFVVGSRS